MKLKPVLSQVSKLDNVKSFDLSLSTCLNRCLYHDIGVCYSKNNPRLRYKKKILKFLEVQKISHTYKKGTLKK